MKMEIVTGLVFDGQCEEAFRFYEHALHAKIAGMFTYAGSPMANDVPADWQQKIMHATLEIGDYALTGSDPRPDQYERPKGLQIMMNLDDPAEADRIFEALSEGGTVGMPIQKTFWALRFGFVVDRFGIPCAVNCERSG